MDMHGSVDVLKKQPWFAASLSWLLPGAGQLFGRAYGGALGFILLVISIEVLYVLFLIYSQASVVTVLILRFCGVAFVAACAARHAYRAASTAKEGLALETRVYDMVSCFPVFLSTVIPGLGQAYLHRWLLAAAYLCLYVAFCLLAAHSYCGTFAVIVLRTVTSVHAYATRPLRGKKHERPLILAMSLLLAACLALNILMALGRARSFVDIGRVVGPSMTPTIAKGSYVVVSKLAYLLEEPSAGDIIMFKAPVHPSVNNEILSCKRIVAVGGETIQLRDGWVYVDGLRRENDIRGRPYLRFPRKSAMPADATGESAIHYAVTTPYRIPDNHYFVLGDNRNNSLDSRCYAAIPRRSIVGRVTKSYRWGEGTLAF